jgi:lipopolysaccharide biosynthesis glycosyltransferase/polysaccharide pyruvyl transferase WcaK-like protein
VEIATSMSRTGVDLETWRTAPAGGRIKTQGHARPIVMACDETYAMPLAVALRSAVEANRSGQPLEVHVLYDHFPSHIRQKVVDSLPEGSALIHWIPVDLREFEAFATLAHISSKLTFARFLIPSIFAEEVHRVLYLDPDLLVLDDLGPLWDMDLRGAVIAAALDPQDANRKTRVPGANRFLDGFPAVRDYFNAGVLVIDLDKWRKEHVSERALEYLRRNPNAFMADQDALNVVCDDCWTELGRRWNFCVPFTMAVAQIPLADRPGIAHFYGGQKPWNPCTLSVNANLYSSFRQRTRFARSPAERLRDFGARTWERFKRPLRETKPGQIVRRLKPATRAIQGQGTSTASLRTATSLAPRQGNQQVKANTVKIAFFGYFGRHNFGNEATLLAIHSNLRRVVPNADFDFVCICNGPEVVAADYNMTGLLSRDYVVKPWKSQNLLPRLARKILVGIPSEFWRWVQSVKALSGTDALIVPGTGLLTDAYTMLGWGPYDLLRWTVGAKLARCKLLFVSVGAGPIYSRAGRAFLKTALWLADFRSYRDVSSRQYLKGAGFPVEKDPIYPDLAFSLLGTALPRTQKNKGGRTVVGLGLMEYGGKYSVESRTDGSNRPYLEQLAEFVTWLLGQRYDVRFLVGDAGEWWVVGELKALIKERLLGDSEGRIIDDPIDSLESLLRQLAATDLVVATRFHNVLLSLLLEKPTIAISFHDKCSSLMSEMGMAQYCEDINDVKAQTLIEKFRRLQQNADSIKQTLQQKVEARRKALDEQYEIIVRTVWPERDRIAQRDRASAPAKRDTVGSQRI